MIKRSFDILVSLIGLIFLSPLMILVGLLIKFLMPGKIFFLQIRVGLNRDEFKIIKFRTMTTIPDSGGFEIGNSSRITPLGKFLRRYKIDEIPQLLNVLKGEMSIVGPRPEVKSWVNVYPEKWDVVLSVKPGLTDNASIMFMNEEQLLNKSEDPELLYRDVILPQKLDYNIKYVNNHTFREDILIILRTIFSIVFK